MKTLTKFATLLFTLVLSTATTAAHACGEVMYRMGGALRYHAFITRHPAEILLYAGSHHSDAERRQFHDNLEKAGHKVTVLTDPDVIIASAADMDVISAQITKASRDPTLIPVLRRDASDESEMRARFPRLVTEDADLNQFLKLIEQSMKARGT